MADESREKRILDRLEFLEAGRRQEVWVYRLIVFVLAIAILGFHTFPSGKYTRLRARSLEIVDPEGEIRMTLEARDTGPIAAWLDSKGEPRVVVSFADREERGSLLVVDEESSILATVSEANSGGVLVLSDRNSASQFLARPLGDGQAVVEVTDSGGSEATLRLGPAQSLLTLEADGEPVWTAP